MGRLDRYAALITGGGKGIGRAVVDRFVAKGANVGVLVRSQRDADSLVAAHGDAVVPVIGDADLPRRGICGPRGFRKSRQACAPGGIVAAKMHLFCHGVVSLWVGVKQGAIISIPSIWSRRMRRR